MGCKWKAELAHVCPFLTSVLLCKLLFSWFKPPNPQFMAEFLLFILRHLHKFHKASGISQKCVVRQFMVIYSKFIHGEQDVRTFF